MEESQEVSLEMPNLVRHSREPSLEMPKPVRATPSGPIFGNLLRVPTTKSIQCDENDEKAEKTSFWSSLFENNDAKSTNKLAIEDQKIFRPKSSVSRSFYR